jgi:hypothetical protein
VTIARNILLASLIALAALVGGMAVGDLAYADGIASVDAGPAPPAAAGIATSPTADVPPAPPADPIADPGDFIDDTREAYQNGGWLGATLLLLYGALLVLQRWIAYLRTGWRKVVIASTLTALVALIAALSNGDPPTFSLVANTLVAAALLAIKTVAAPSGEVAT